MSPNTGAAYTSIHLEIPGRTVRWLLVDFRCFISFCFAIMTLVTISDPVSLSVRAAPVSATLDMRHPVK
ncbi:hypothetical protein TC41_0690 [Alicyclobacillus acidocaldarius subsp. acidocaldarius Tc-4-1]|uniref:Uncharacterized protein n=1 Tax=Alicyclobacillus acidocaldarius (strain Tc-4-1) TaxID=1048834 RepID=F8IDZ2_ALIAT|nr:hypothetical protein TC41_0690 [Alicyclobacillus acidocaldarius subsp. acidocaldarius Tc-4-1]